MIRRPPRPTRTDTLFPYTTLCRSSRFAGPSLSRKGRGEFDRLPCRQGADALDHGEEAVGAVGAERLREAEPGDGALDVDRQDLLRRDRKSTRLNSSH